MPKNNIKLLLFDLGGVIINLYPEKTFHAFSEIADLPKNKIMAAYEDAAYFKLHEKGLLKNDVFRDKLRSALNFVTDDTTLDSAWNAMLGDIPNERINQIRELKKQYKCMVLSNTNAIHERAFHQILQKAHAYKHLNELFDKVFFSHELNERKPNIKIYKDVIARCGFKAEEILFLDDSIVNTDAAERAGMQSLLIKRNGGFADLLRQKLKSLRHD